MKNSSFLLLPFFLLFGLCAPALSYDHVETVNVGKIVVYGNSGAANYFTKADGSDFAHCTNSTKNMWIDSSYVTTEGRQAILSTLLTAKTTQTPVTIYYVVDQTGTCLYQIVSLD